MLQFDFQSSLGYWICMTARAYERAMNQELLPEGITHRQCQVLAWLALEGELSQVDLAERMNIEPATLVRVLDRMERDGLLSREISSRDRRRKIIKPTKKALPIWEKITACANRVRERASEGMNPAQLEVLRGLLDQVQFNLAADVPVAQLSEAAWDARGPNADE